MAFRGIPNPGSGSCNIKKWGDFLDTRWNRTMRSESSRTPKSANKLASGKSKAFKWDPSVPYLDIVPDVHSVHITTIPCLVRKISNLYYARLHPSSFVRIR